MNVHHKYVLIMVSALVLCSRADQYIYPVGVLHLDHASWLYCMYQKNLSAVELWQVNLATGNTNKALLSTFMPHQFRIVPGNAGFSFLDDGRIRVKNFTKRSPKALDIYEPLTSIGSFDWLDDNAGYFSAQQAGRSGIYTIDMQGQARAVCWDEAHDYLYPSAADGRLWYIERTQSHEHHAYAIGSCLYDGSDRRQIVSCANMPIAFLLMKDQTLGLVIEHPLTFDSSSDQLALRVHGITDNNGVWTMNYLFTFSLPTERIFFNNDETTLYESLLPMLPRFIGEYIIFSDYKNNVLNLYSYDLRCGQIIQHTFGSCCFCPISVGDRIYYGGTCDEGSEPHMRVNDEGDNELALPYFTLPISR